MTHPIDEKLKNLELLIHCHYGKPGPHIEKAMLELLRIALDRCADLEKRIEKLED